jgi:hypothetical protein
MKKIMILFATSLLLIGCKTNQIIPAAAMSELQTIDAVSTAIIDTASDSTVPDAEFLLEVAQKTEDPAIIHIAETHLEDVKKIAETAKSQIDTQKESREVAAEIETAAATAISEKQEAKTEVVKSKGQRNVLLVILIAIAAAIIAMVVIKLKKFWK